MCKDRIYLHQLIHVHDPIKWVLIVVVYVNIKEKKKEAKHKKINLFITLVNELGVAKLSILLEASGMGNYFPLT